MYKYKNQEILNPPAYEPSESEIKLAKARYAMENNIWEMIHFLIQHYELTKGKEPSYPYTKEMVEKEAERSIERWNKYMNRWNDDIIEAFVDNDWFKTVYIYGLSDIHSGDCTGFPSSCSRCHAEELFGITSTVKWGKAEGQRLWKEFSDDVDRQKKEEAENQATGNENV
jgi:hypothetical protein